jgi:hypothetical protein
MRDDLFNDSTKIDTTTATSMTLPTFAKTPAEFWNQLDSQQELYRIKDLVRALEFWNDTSMTWDMIYDNMRNSGNARIDMAMYPFEGNSTLLCHTLQQGLAEFGTKFRIVMTSAASTS